MLAKFDGSKNIIIISQVLTNIYRMTTSSNSMQIAVGNFRITSFS
jgi:hypothetical protein